MTTSLANPSIDVSFCAIGVPIDIKLTNYGANLYETTSTTVLSAATVTLS